MNDDLPPVSWWPCLAAALVTAVVVGSILLLGRMADGVATRPEPHTLKAYRRAFDVPKQP